MAHNCLTTLPRRLCCAYWYAMLAIYANIAQHTFSTIRTSLHGVGMAEKKQPIRKEPTTTVRLTKDAHILLTTLASMQDVTMSEAIVMLIRDHVPEVEREVERREAIRREFQQKSKSEG